MLGEKIYPQVGLCGIGSSLVRVILNLSKRKLPHFSHHRVLQGGIYLN